VEECQGAGNLEDLRQHAGYLGRLEQIDHQWQRAFTEFRAKRVQRSLAAIDQHHRRTLADEVRAHSSPMPDAAPVMAATLPFMSSAHEYSSLLMVQARPWLTRERRASESTITAMARTAPVIMYRSDELRLSSVSRWISPG
jgi:hypothetical protein